MARVRVRGGVALALCVAMAGASVRAEVLPHRSAKFLPTSNGRGTAAFGVAQSRITRFYEHAYRHPSAGRESRNFAYDSYPGVRVGTRSAWLPARPADTLEFVPGTGVVRAVRTFENVRLEELHFMPQGVPENVLVTVVTATRLAGSDPVDVYALFNYHLGEGSPEPSSAREEIARDASRHTFYEWGPAAVTFAHTSLVAPTHFSVTPDNPWVALNQGRDLGDIGATAQPTDDAVCGFQYSLGALSVGASATVGWMSLLAPDADAAPRVDRVKAWINGRTPRQLVDDEIASWNAWTTEPPASASASERALALQSQAMLRMAQVTEPGRGNGQILASLAPGRWNITWVRDMAYAVAALVRTGHYEEAKRALAFQVGAQAGAYREYVGAPYRISVVRYYGDGSEESDWNGFGPNVEFDGFGLFLWTLDEYVRASGDTASLAAWWPVVRAEVADVLVALQEPSGLIKADSSIWEVHWEGKQKHFAYTTLTAASGLCSAGRLAQLAGDAAAAARYTEHGAKARDALVRHLRAPDGTLAQATESLASGAKWLDASAVEAFNQGLLDPRGPTAAATLRSIRERLVPPSARGFMRNDNGEWYDSQEWVFVDFRAGHAHRLAGQAAIADTLLAWNVAQAEANFNEIAELHEAASADYAGEVPMIGFGAGSYLLALMDRGTAPLPTCGAFADESGGSADAGSNPEPDAGAENDAGPRADAGVARDGGRPDAGAGRDAGTSGGSSDGRGRDAGCTCAAPALGGALAPWALLLVRRRRTSRA